MSERKKLMKQAKTLVLLGLFLIIVIGMIGCSSGGSSSGGSSSTVTATMTQPANPLVGTWTCNSGFDVGIKLVFNADGTGTAGSSVFYNWVLNVTKLTWTGNGGNSKVFTLVWDAGSDNGFTLTNTNPATPTVDHFVKAS